MSNTGIILTLAYPDTIVMTADEWYSPYMRYIGIGKKNYVRAGHAALVLIKKETGILEYHDFGRYITPEPNGRVRGKRRDRELDFPLKAQIQNNEIQNLEELLHFLASNPKLTHGDGKLVASVCDAVNYEQARLHIDKLQARGSFRYAAFIDDACNCARFVTTTLVASATDAKIKRKLEKSLRFTPSTVGNVLLANTKQQAFEATPNAILPFTSSVRKENLRCFLDRLPDHTPNFVGTLKPKPVEGISNQAQWLEGIASGAWFELFAIENDMQNYRIRRVSPYGNIDVDGVFAVNDTTFDASKSYAFIHDSNCLYCTILQGEKKYTFNFIRDY